MKKLTLIAIFTTLFLGYLNAAETRASAKPFTKVAFDEGIKYKLILGGRAYDLQAYNINYINVPAKNANDLAASSFNYQMNTVGITSSKVDQDFLDWMFLSNKDPKNGQVIVSDTESGKVLKTINFTGLTGAVYSEYSNINLNNGPTQVNTFSLRFVTINIKLPQL